MIEANSKAGTSMNIIFELMRFVTPALIAITLAFVNSINGKIDSLDDKVFKHLTNDEIHAPRSQFVSDTQFDLYQKMRDKEMDSMGSCVLEIKQLIKETIAENNEKTRH